MTKIPFFLFLALVLSLASCKNDAHSTAKQSEVTQTSKPALTEADIAKYTAKGKAIAQASFKTLAGNLKKAMGKGGPVEAVKFCNVKASSLVDSLMTAHHAIIKRTSSKIRNPKNAPTELEAKQIAAYMEAIKANKPLKPKVVLTDDNKVQFFAPIKTAAVCLNCHGTATGENLPKQYAAIKELYPNDQATGYKEGDLRGIWSIQFER